MFVYLLLMAVGAQEFVVVGAHDLATLKAPTPAPASLPPVAEVAA